MFEFASETASPRLKCKEDSSSNSSLAALILNQIENLTIIYSERTVSVIVVIILLFLELSKKLKEALRAMQNGASVRSSSLQRWALKSNILLTKW